jgi:hypothetical protein
MNLTVTKTRLKGAQTGHSLLKKKADALGKVRWCSVWTGRSPAQAKVFAQRA